MDARARRRPSGYPGLGLAVLVVNAGSTSLKLHLVESDDSAERVIAFDAVDPAAVEAVAHRIVHGGTLFREPVLIDGQVRHQVFALTTLAPLHNAPALAAIEEAEAAFPNVPHVAVFDTGFHATIPREASVYALPRTWREDWQVHRYGFHGLSVQWSSERAVELLGQAAERLRLVVCHLGGGCSVTAVSDGRSVDTTMGFSPLEGVPMATRSGSIDPGILIYVSREHGLDAETLDRTLNFEAGLKGLAGGSGSMVELEERALAGEPDAVLALDVFLHRLAAAIAGMAAAIGGLDALVFTAGIGEGSAVIRHRACERLRFLGLEIDEARNSTAAPDCDVAAPESPVRILVVHAREEVVAARAARHLLGAQALAS